MGKYAPCIRPASTCPWRPRKRSSRQSQAERQRPHPKTQRQTSQHISHNQNIIIPSITYHGEVLERPGGLNVVQGLLQVNQLGLDLALGLLSVLHSLGLKGIDGLELTGNIVGGRLEVLELSLDVIDDGLVLQGVAVVVEVDGLGLLGKNLELAARIVVTLLEALESGGRLAAEAERAGHLGPVDFESGTALFNTGAVSGPKLPQSVGGGSAEPPFTYSCHYG